MPEFFPATTLAPRVNEITDPLLGSGRSGVVFKSRDGQGRITARKVFDSDALTRAVQYFFLGCPNPYAWSEHAIQAALLRRRILAPLVQHWLGDLVRVAEGWNADWNEEHLAWQLHTQFVKGTHPILHHPMNRRGAEEVNELRTKVMAPLLAHLLEAGLDGQVWQAGLGNPVALANFMMERDDQDRRRWVWIDLESGVPALFPANPMALLRFYLPRAWRLRRPLFDDVDVPRLTAWMTEHREELVESLDAPTVEGLERDIAALDHHQEAWTSMSRISRSVGSQLAKRRLTEEQAAHYEAHPLRWYAREGRRAVLGVGRRVMRKLGSGWRWLKSLPWSRMGQGLAGFLFSQRYRAQLAEGFLEHRIESWSTRGQLTDDEAGELRSHLGREESSAYLTDFGVHVAIKPFVKSIEWFLCPALFAAGIIDQNTLTVILLTGGLVGRTLYTAGRFIQSLLRGRELPWIALGVGVLTGDRKPGLSAPDRRVQPREARPLGAVHPLRLLYGPGSPPPHLGRPRHAYRTLVQPPARPGGRGPRTAG